ncbi:uncharacterized protein LAESUDRAFT_431177 [Laetiporus sulphureus 93-53]|uniref:Uncharacterized protein n=1 Tax=Laetiporus sulphureus 93-53 TaxID=1314785 RepID=A0A165C4S2_9APHY|nr:uncharacterized protein LAESUDRAFT_431177 [Laetiporus sulphureus 93-53]KZT02202.1 hypothetical protein LAESUDRAFT_431177 [Laetiporus sulphureus 93-53]
MFSVLPHLPPIQSRRLGTGIYFSRSPASVVLGALYRRVLLHNSNAFHRWRPSGMPPRKAIPTGELSARSTRGSRCHLEQDGGVSSSSRQARVHALCQWAAAILVVLCLRMPPVRSGPRLSLLGFCIMSGTIASVIQCSIVLMQSRTRNSHPQMHPLGTCEVVREQLGRSPTDSIVLDGIVQRTGRLDKHNPPSTWKIVMTS